MGLRGDFDGYRAPPWRFRAVCDDCGAVCEQRGGGTDEFEARRAAHQVAADLGWHVRGQRLVLCPRCDPATYDPEQPRRHPVESLRDGLLLSPAEETD